MGAHIPWNLIHTCVILTFVEYMTISATIRHRNILTIAEHMTVSITIRHRVVHSILTHMRHDPAFHSNIQNPPIHTIFLINNSILTNKISDSFFIPVKHKTQFTQLSLTRTLSTQDAIHTISIDKEGLIHVLNFWPKENPTSHQNREPKF